MSDLNPIGVTDDVFRIHCQHCGGGVKFPSEGVGQLVKCPHCANQLTLVDLRSQAGKEDLEAVRNQKTSEIGAKAQPHTSEKSTGAGVFYALALIIAIGVGAYLLVNQPWNQQVRHGDLIARLAALESGIETGATAQQTVKLIADVKTELKIHPVFPPGVFDEGAKLEYIPNDKDYFLKVHLSFFTVYCDYFLDHPSYRMDDLKTVRSGAESLRLELEKRH
jgi:hypothetical protein